MIGPYWLSAVLYALVATIAPSGLATPRAGTPGAGDAATQVLVTDVTGPITPVIADHLDDAVERAEDGYEALVVELDTPGGLDSAMRSIVQSFLQAEVPVVVYVSPRGGRAASAGALITMSAHIAAMAPGTTIGAATPVDLEGGEVGDKVVNDAASYAQAIAEERDRNVEFAVETVREGRSVSASTAAEIGAVDLVAPNRRALLDGIDGQRVTVAGDRVRTLNTADASIDEFDLSLFRRVLQYLADPNLAFILLSVGTLALIYELASPGGGVAGVLGVLMIVVALFSLAVLPINLVGLIFLAVAIGCFIAELYAPGVGVFAFLGAGALVLSGLFLFSEEGPGVSLSLAAVLPTAVVVAGGVLVAGRLALRSRKARMALGMEHLVGQEVVVAHADEAGAQARVEGAWWNVRPTRGRLQPGQRVRICRTEDLTLIVEPIEQTEAT